MLRVIIAMTALACFGVGGHVVAAEAAAGGANATVERTVEDGIDLLLVTVTTDGKPVEGAAVRVTVDRAFGQLVLGEEKTFDDGTAYIPLPERLPPAAAGRLTANVEVTTPASSVGARTSIELADAPVAGADTPPYAHRALWARHAPVSLLATLTILLGGVWVTYAFVARQVYCLRKGI